MDKFTKEFGHTPKADKLERVLDGMVGKEGTGNVLADVDTIKIIVAKRKRGRPKGSKNKPKPTLIRPELVGHIPEDDLIVRRH